VWCDIRGGDLSPERIGASVALGAFIGCLPLFGLHLPIVLILCLRLRLDGALCYLAANISNPFLAPLLFTAEVQVGAFVLLGEVPPLSSRVELWEALKSFPKFLIVGSPIVGLAAASVLGPLAWLLTISKRRLFGVGTAPRYVLPASASDWVVAVEHVAARYVAHDDRSASAKAQFNYVRIKLLMDPIAKLIADIEGDRAGTLGEVFDIGTGRGQLPILLCELGRATRARGFDWDEKKIADGARAAKILPPLPIELWQSDARSGEVTPADTVLLVDLLHYFTIEEQDEILLRAAMAVKPGGRLLVREADTDRGWRSTMTLLEEKLFTALRFNRGERVRFRRARDLTAVMESAGLTVEVRPAWGKTPFSNVLFIGRRG
jgi:SAM-dependent methyltransferase